MLPSVRTAAGARLAAALLAVTLTGATTLLPAMGASEGRHRCSCAERFGEQHECECAICRRAALLARAADEQAPPCHRAAARNALVESAPPGSLDAASVECICGEPLEPTATPAGVGPFCWPVHRPVALSDRTEPGRPANVDRERAGPVEPETPPPRAA